MPSLLDQLPPRVKVPRRYAKSYRLLQIFIEGFSDGRLGIQQFEFGDDFHRDNGTKAISSYIEGHDAGKLFQQNQDNKAAAIQKGGPQDGSAIVGQPDAGGD